ncbi:MAG: hypothetical protein FWH36_08670 [Lentimicrobiaceae bacterium]|nr:hypothetical protein [Lentimicrobiaceae bacterium]
MESLESLEEKIKNMEDEKIIKKKGNPIYSVVLLIAGVAVIVFGAAVLHGGSLGFLTITSGIVIAVAGLIYILKNTGIYYVYEPTGKKLKKYKVSLDESDAKKIVSCISSKNFTAVKYMKKVITSGDLIEARGTDDGAVFLFQLSKYVPHNFVPSTPIVVLHGEDAKLMLEFVKS